MARFFERLLNLQRGDLARGALLFSYLFFAMLTYVMGKAAARSLFLSQFEPSKLAYADMAITVLMGFVAAAYVALSRRLSLQNLQFATLAFFTLNCGIFWYLSVMPSHATWLYPAFYIWVGIIGVVAPAQVWTTANFVLTTREAKRIYGLVGGGAIAGGISAGLLTNVVGKRFHTESLLLLMTFWLAAAAVIVMVIWKRKQASAAGQGEEEGNKSKKKAESVDLLKTLKLISSTRYLLAICAVICMASVVSATARWQFVAIAREAIPKKDELTAFLGAFDFFAGIASLITQLLITGRLLRRFGIGMALFVVPVWLLLGTGGVLVWGTLLAASTMRAGDQVLRYSIDKSSVELLFLPIPANIKVQVKSFIDVVVWRFGDGLMAITIAVLADQLKWGAQRIGWVNLVYVFIWMAAALVARRQYVATLRESILQHRLDVERSTAAVLDRSATDLIADRLTEPDPKEILYALKLFEVGRHRVAHPAIRGLLSHPTPEVRQRAIAILNASDDTGVIPQVEKLLSDEHLDVRTEALLYLGRHTNIDPLARLEQLGDFPDFSIRSAMVAYLARPGEAQDVETARMMFGTMIEETGEEGKRARLEAARLLAVLPDYFIAEHEHLLSDADPDVVREAVRAVAHQPSRSFVPRLLLILRDPALAPDAIEALAVYGEGLVPILRDALRDPHIPIEARREIPAVLAHIGTPSAGEVLNQAVMESDTQLRYRVIAALNKLCQVHPEIQCDKMMVETLLAAEIMGHYRSYQILGTLGEAAKSEEPVARGLEESMHQEIERIFRLLALLHPHLDLHSAYYGVQSKDPVVHDNALEFLDNVLEPAIRKVLLPLVDSSVSVAERVRLAGKEIGADVENREQAVAAMVRSEDPWLMSCGAYAVGTLGLRSLEADLDRCLHHPDPLLRETARQAKLRLANLQPA